MSDYDSLTNREVASFLEKFKAEFIKGRCRCQVDHFDAIMMQAIKRLREQAEPNQFQVFDEHELNEIRRQLTNRYHRNHRNDQLRDYTQHPVQFLIYKKLSLFSEWFKCQEFVGKPEDGQKGYCQNNAEWLTNPFSASAQVLFIKIARDAGIDDAWCVEGEKAITTYFGEHFMDVIVPQFRCEEHIKKLKEIAVKI